MERTRLSRTKNWYDYRAATVLINCFLMLISLSRAKEMTFDLVNDGDTQDRCNGYQHNYPYCTRTYTSVYEDDE